MSKQCFSAKNALGPYSQAVCAGNFIFLSGQLGLDPETNALAPGGIEGETQQALDNISSFLTAHGLSIDDVVKATVFLRDMGDYARMNEIYGQVFSRDFPARSAVQVAALPKNAAVEIEVIAVCRESPDAAVASRRVTG
jgi:2-iminobutanoate/2-iminopropanoate deaminase